MSTMFPEEVHVVDTLTLSITKSRRVGLKLLRVSFGMHFLGKRTHRRLI